MNLEKKRRQILDSLNTEPWKPSPFFYKVLTAILVGYILTVLAWSPITSWL